MATRNTVKMNCDLCGKECEHRYCSRDHWLEAESPRMIKEARLNVGELDEMEMKNLDQSVNLTSRIINYVNSLDDISMDDLSGLFIYGSNGTGKTFIMVAIAKEIIRRMGLPVVMVDVPEWISGFYGSIKRRNEMIGKLKDVNVLLMDDLGAEQQTEYTIPILGELINHRWVHKRLTYFTSNLTPELVKKKIDPRIISRISGMCKFIRLTGEDRRVT